MTKPKVLILHATGTNRDREAAQAIGLAGGEAEIVHVNQLRDGGRQLKNYQVLLLPGGFSYGDDLGAGRLWASDLSHLLRDQVGPFVEAGRPVIGICNGFQALVKSGWLPGDLAGVEAASSGMHATLTRNASNRFECRWVWLEPDPDSPCVFTKGLREPIYCPVAHGEGRFVPRDDAVLERLQQDRLVAVRYVAPDGDPAELDGAKPSKAGRRAAQQSWTQAASLWGKRPPCGASGPAAYPHNPNGSVADIAGICNATGTVFGLMPHPEDHIFPEQHPRWTRGERGNLGLVLFENGIRYAADC